MEDSLRIFVSTARLVGESQVIERCLNAFARKYYADVKTTSVLKSESAAIVLSYSIMILHTDLYHKTLKVGCSSILVEPHESRRFLEEQYQN